MKILQVNLTGKSGSTGKIVNDLKKYLSSQGHDTIVAYSVDDITDEGFFKISHRWELALSRRLIRYGRASYKGNPFAFRRLKKIIQEECPDIVHLHCINCCCVNIYSTLSYLGRSKIRTVITHHAEFFYTGSCPYAFDCTKYIDQECVGCENELYATSNVIYADTHKCWNNMFGAFSNFEQDKLIFVAVSPWVEKRSTSSPIVNRFPCATIYNGLDTSVFHHKEFSAEFQSKLGSVKRIILHVTPNFNPADKENIKGGYYVVELAKKMPQFRFLIVASSSKNTGNLPENIQLWGKASSQEELAQLYSNAEITLLTSKRETFSMVTAESLCCGTPVVGFEAGGPESIAHSKYSKFVKHGDIDALCLSIRHFITESFDKKTVSSECQRIYSKEVMGEKYLELYNQLLKNS